MRPSDTYGAEWEIGQALDNTPEYCSCSCHISQHEYTLTPYGGIQRCRTAYHRCPPVPAMSKVEYQSLLHECLKRRGESLARYHPHSQQTDEILKEIRAELRELNSEGMRRR